MGFDFPDDETVGAESAKGIPVDNKSERLKQQWREIEEETKKSAGRGEGGPADRDMEEEGALPEPDAEGRRMAESEEVRMQTAVCLFVLAVCWQCVWSFSLSAGFAFTGLRGSFVYRERSVLRFKLSPSDCFCMRRRRLAARGPRVKNRFRLFICSCLW